LNTQNNFSVTVDAIEAVLPQTQCRQCGFPGCRPYAEALSIRAAPLDRCKPGGTYVIQRLQDLIPSLSPIGSVTPQDQNPLTQPAACIPAPEVAWIDESQCIGCALCIAVCPVDAIIGSAQLMHTVLPTDCTGCGLCVAPCPVECIHIQPHPSPDPVSGYAVPPEKAQHAFLRQHMRRTAEQHQKTERLLALYHPIQQMDIAPPAPVPQEERSNLIEELRKRAKERRNKHEP
jgi:Na+-translocating ferredoxin:NAD+ oxidoreductase subunit B